MRLEDRLEGEFVDILSMCGENVEELTTMFVPASEALLIESGGTVIRGIRRYLNRLEQRGIITPSPGDPEVWELTEKGRAIATERHAAEDRGEDPDT